MIYPNIDGQLELEAELQHALGRTEDFIEGGVSFVEKRPPVFRGA
jgi:2-(1,2-epoxy-1,2-dihydrophenyl)acetyl-CoA isomerase